MNNMWRVCRLKLASQQQPDEPGWCHELPLPHPCFVYKKNTDLSWVYLDLEVTSPVYIACHQWGKDIFKMRHAQDSPPSLLFPGRCGLYNCAHMAAYRRQKKKLLNQFLYWWNICNLYFDTCIVYMFTLARSLLISCGIATCFVHSRYYISTAVQTDFHSKSAEMFISYC